MVKDLKDPTDLTDVVQLWCRFPNTRNLRWGKQHISWHKALGFLDCARIFASIFWTETTSPKSMQLIRTWGDLDQTFAAKDRWKHFTFLDVFLCRVLMSLGLGENLKTLCIWLILTLHRDMIFTKIFHRYVKSSHLLGGKKTHIATVWEIVSVFCFCHPSSPRCSAVWLHHPLAGRLQWHGGSVQGGQIKALTPKWWPFPVDLLGNPNIGSWDQPLIQPLIQPFINH